MWGMAPEAQGDARPLGGPAVNCQESPCPRAPRGPDKTRQRHTERRGRRRAILRGTRRLRDGSVHPPTDPLTIYTPSPSSTHPSSCTSILLLTCPSFRLPVQPSVFAVIHPFLCLPVNQPTHTTAHHQPTCVVVHPRSYASILPPRPRCSFLPSLRNRARPSCSPQPGPPLSAGLLAVT